MKLAAHCELQLRRVQAPFQIGATVENPHIDTPGSAVISERFTSPVHVTKPERIPISPRSRPLKLSTSAWARVRRDPGHRDPVHREKSHKGPPWRWTTRQEGSIERRGPPWTNGARLQHSRATGPSTWIPRIFGGAVHTRFLATEWTLSPLPSALCMPSSGPTDIYILDAVSVSRCNFILILLRCWFKGIFLKIFKWFFS